MLNSATASSLNRWSQSIAVDNQPGFSLPYSDNTNLSGIGCLRRRCLSSVCANRGHLTHTCILRWREQSTKDNIRLDGDSHRQYICFSYYLLFPCHSIICWYKVWRNSLPLHININAISRWVLGRISKWVSLFRMKGVSKNTFKGKIDQKNENGKAWGGLHPPPPLIWYII